MKNLILLTFIIFFSGCVKNLKPQLGIPKVSEAFFSQQCFGANFFNEKESSDNMLAAKRLGVNFIRLTPSKWKSFRPGAKHGEFLIGDQKEYRGLYKKDLDELRRVLDLAHNAGLKVVLTFLNIPGRMWRQHHGNKIDCRLWQDLQYHAQAAQFMSDVSFALGHHPAIVAINPINEPEPEHCAARKLDWADAKSYAQWQHDVVGSASDLNLLYQELFSAIRKFSRDVAIVFESSFYSTPAALPFIKPFVDRNVIYSFHMYEPYSFALQKQAGSHYPGKATLGENSKDLIDFDRGMLEKMLKPVTIWQHQNNIANHQIMVGEFGVDRLAPGAQQYLVDLIDIFNQKSWHWAFYSFRENGFAKMDYEMGLKKPGWKYWQAIEKHQTPDRRVYGKSQLLEVIQNGMMQRKK